MVVEGAASLPVEVKGFDLYWILNSEAGRNFLLKLCEYFGLFIALVFYNETYFPNSAKKSQTDGNAVKFEENERDVMKGLSITIFVIIAYFFFLLYKTSRSLGKIFWKFFWVGLNLVSNSLNLAIVIMTLIAESADDSYTPNIRRIESVAVVLMWLRFLYFFRILDNTAPLIRMISQILYDMRAFVFIFVLIILGFANGFYVLAKNQMAALKSEDGTPEIPYMTYGQSIFYVYTTSIGEFGTDSYALGED